MVEIGFEDGPRFIHTLSARHFDGVQRPIKGLIDPRKLACVLLQNQQQECVLVVHTIRIFNDLNIIIDMSAPSLTIAAGIPISGPDI